MPSNSLLRQLIGQFVDEHRCAPPDVRSEWIAVPSASSASKIGIYVCPECGQHLTRATNFTVIHAGRLQPRAERPRVSAPALWGRGMALRDS